MDFGLTEEEELFQKMARDFCEKRLRPRAREIDDGEKIPDDILKEMADLGLLGITIPQEYGGPGGNTVMAALGGIEVGRGDISMATVVFYLLEAGWSLIFSRYGTEEAKREILPKVAKGQSFLGICTTEPGGGSDIANMKTTARREGDYFVINGEKGFISGLKECGRMSGGHLTLVKTNPEAGTRGMSFLYVPLNTPGITTTIYKHMGRMGISTGGVSYKDVRVPAKYLMGEENKGFYVAMSGFNAARPLVSAACIGAAERGLEIGIEYIKERQAFGRPIGKFEGVQFEVVEQYSMIEMTKLAILKAAWMIDRYPNPDRYTTSEITKTVAIGKLHAPQVAFETIKKAMIWFGAAGYSKENELEMGLRGVMSYLAGAEGAQNIMKIILGRELLGDEFVPYR